MKFIHAADIHLDSPLAGLQARDDLPTEIIRNCTRRAFKELIDLAIREDVAFLVLAGDLYDGDWKDFSTGLFFAGEMQRLGRPCFLLHGNHDAQSVITRNLQLPNNVRVFPSHTCDTFILDDLGVALHGRSFPNRAVPEDLTPGYPTPIPGIVNIGVLHTSAEDPGEHQVYAPCSRASLELKQYDYWALGHVHTARVPSRPPWIVFPGNIQGRHARETGPKGCVLVTVEDRRIAHVEPRTLDVLRWNTLDVDASGADLPTLIERIGDKVGEAITEADGRPILARLKLTGRSPIHGALLGQSDKLGAECRAAALAGGGALWVEKLQIRTSPTRSTASDTLEALRPDFMAGLDDPDVVAGLLKELAEVRQKLPQEARAELDLPEDEDALRKLAGDAWAIAAGMLKEADQG